MSPALHADPAPAAHPAENLPSDVDAALPAYEALAPHYDAFTAGYEHDRWLAALERAARRHGLRGRRLLDVACGTGKSFAPMLGRGYRVTACDLSPAMVAVARRRSAGRARVFVADVRSLPALGAHDLVTCLDDALNYLLTDADLQAAVRGMAACLASDGLLVFDVNSLGAYRGPFGDSFEQRHGPLRFLWRGESSAEVSAGCTLAATVEVQHAQRGSLGVSRHVQRHHRPASVLRALDLAGLEPVGVYGQLPGARLERPPDEARHTKLVWVAAHVRGRKGGRAVIMKP